MAQTEILFKAGDDLTFTDGKIARVIKVDEEVRPIIITLNPYYATTDLGNGPGMKKDYAIHEIPGIARHGRQYREGSK